MKSSLDSTLNSVWRQALVENADAVKLGTEIMQSPEAKQNAFGKLRLFLMEIRLWESSRTRRQNRDGLQWREGERK